MIRCFFFVLFVKLKSVYHLKIPKSTKSFPHEGRATKRPGAIGVNSLFIQAIVGHRRIIALSCLSG